MRQIFLEKILDKADDLDMDDVSSTASNNDNKNNDDMYRDWQEPYDMWICLSSPARDIWPLEKVKGIKQKSLQGTLDPWQK